MSAKEKSKEVNEVSTEKLLGINSGLNVVMENKTCPRVLAYKIGIYKAKIELLVREYKKQKTILDEEFSKKAKVNKATKAKELSEDDKEKYKKEKDGLLDVMVEIPDTKFTLSEFEDVEEIPPVFYTYMDDIVTE